MLAFCVITLIISTISICLVILGVREFKPEQNFRWETAKLALFINIAYLILPATFLFCHLNDWYPKDTVSAVMEVVACLPPYIWAANAWTLGKPKSPEASNAWKITGPRLAAILIVLVIGISPYIGHDIYAQYRERQRIAEDYDRCLRNDDALQWTVEKVFRGNGDATLSRVSIKAPYRIRYVYWTAGDDTMHVRVVQKDGQSADVWRCSPGTNRAEFLQRGLLFQSVPLTSATLEVAAPERWAIALEVPSFKPEYAELAHAKLDTLVAMGVVSEDWARTDMDSTLLRVVAYNRKHGVPEKDRAEKDSLLERVLLSGDKVER